LEIQAVSYPHQKFYEAVACLISEGPLRKRLASAAQYLVTLQPTNFTGKDAEHLEAWEQIRDDLTWADPDQESEGKIEATIKRMIDRDAERCAQDILGLFLKLSGGLR
jgi:hypothetical protein